MNSSHTAIPRDDRRMTFRIVAARLLWLLATGLIAGAAVVYFAAGGSDDASTADRVALAAIPFVLALLPLSLAAGLARRAWGSARRGAAAAISAALLLLVCAGGLLELARVLSTSGDAAWTLYWVVCLLAWTAISGWAVRRDRVDARLH